MRVCNGSRLTRLAILVAGLLSASSCTKQCGDFKVFDFAATPGIGVGEARIPTLNGLERANAFPTNYVAQRGNYRLFIRANEKAYGPEVTLTVESSSVPLLPKLVSVPRAADGSSCISTSESKDGLKMSWLDWRDCAANQIVGVAIVDRAGARVASEELVFKVVANGRYCVED